MKRFIVVVTGALVVAIVAAVVSLPTSLSAQTAPEILDACDSGQRAIRAAELPRVVEPEACSLEGKIIRDNGAGIVVPAPGESVHAEAMTTAGSQVLELTRSEDGTVELGSVGDEVKNPPTQNSASTYDVNAASSPYACNDPAYNIDDIKWYDRLGWYFNRSTTPNELTRNGATGAIRRGGANITGARNNCGMADDIPARIGYLGNTSRRANINASADCTTRDGTSVVSFGDLPVRSNNITTIGTACNWSRGPRYPQEIIESDIKINKVEAQWTTTPYGSCYNRQDLESLVTHERGHSFGLDHVAESSHKWLTMSPTLEGPKADGTCRALERTLGRGDVRGLRARY